MVSTLLPQAEKRFIYSNCVISFFARGRKTEAQKWRVPCCRRPQNSLIQIPISRQRQELAELRAGGQRIEQLGCAGEFALGELLGAIAGLDLVQFLADQLAGQVDRDLAAVVQHALFALNPLPDL